jgi:hypothetical protein
LNVDQGLRDPCEHEDVDVTSYLTLQQREDLTRSAQHFLRMMHFRQIHIVLGMPMEDDDYSKGRRHHGGGKNGTAAAKAGPEPIKTEPIKTEAIKTEVTAQSGNGSSTYF